MAYPLLQEISYQDPLTYFAIFSEKDGAVFLDSAQLRQGCGRYSFIATDPFLTLRSKNGRIHLAGETLLGDPFKILKENLDKFTLHFHPGLPPFQGGVVGFFSYDLCQHLFKLPAAKMDDMQFPDLVLGFYDVVLAFDNLTKQAWVFSSGYPVREQEARKQHAKKRLENLIKQIEQVTAMPALTQTICAEQDIRADFLKHQYATAVRKVVDYILAGDIFQANISQRFITELPENFTAFDLYRRLRLLNPAPFAAYLNFADIVLVSASPERFLKLTAGQVETRPIKGTRPRGKNQLDDENFAHELLASEKDHAENVMIVDLLRNDLSRVCEDHSVQVPQLCQLESYATVHHLVSVVIGKLQKKYHALDLFCAAFPGGSITGAPKIRAMEIIAEIEPTSRGPYCGSIGYIGFDGDMDLSIVIRTYAIKNNIVTFQAGGAVVADSNPVAEYEETLTKARALRNALMQAVT